MQANASGALRRRHAQSYEWDSLRRKIAAASAGAACGDIRITRRTAKAPAGATAALNGDSPAGPLPPVQRKHPAPG